MRFRIGKEWLIVFAIVSVVGVLLHSSVQRVRIAAMRTSDS
jgi:hypothetical protein